MTRQQIKPLIKRGKELYPNKFMRHQWVRKSLHLYETGAHLLTLGNIRRG